MTPRLKCRRAGSPPSATACASASSATSSRFSLQREAAAVDLHQGEPRSHGRGALVELEGLLALAARVRGSRPRLTRALRFSGSSSSTRSKPVAASSARPRPGRRRRGRARRRRTPGRARPRAARPRSRRARSFAGSRPRRGRGGRRGCRGPSAPAPRAAVGVVEPSRVPQRLGLQQLLQERELVLRVGPRARRAAARGRVGPAHVAEGLQALEGLGSIFPGVGSSPAFQQAARVEVRGQGRGDARVLVLTRRGSSCGSARRS